MRLAFFGAHKFEREAFLAANAAYGHEIAFFEHRLTAQTAPLAEGFSAVCSFVNDELNAETLSILHDRGVRMVALRSAGFNHVDGATAKSLGMRVTRVPAYSPHAVAEHAVGLLLTLNRKICRASSRVRELNFSLDGLVGFDLHGKTVGVLGTGKIGAAFGRIMHGFGCRLLAYDVQPDQGLARELNLSYVALERIYAECDVISLHVPLVPATRHLLNDRAFEMMKNGVIIINTGRGALIDTKALIRGLKARRIGGAGLDVYEEEENVFFQDLSAEILEDDVLARLMTFPNVLITAHQGFLTREALRNIADSTLLSVHEFERGLPLSSEILFSPKS